MRKTEPQRSENWDVVVLVAVVFVCVLAGVIYSGWSDIQMARAGLEQCYENGHANPVWRHSCERHE